LHSARYPRKPRGGPDDLGASYEWRFSFCCAHEGCRRRTTPPSVRYLGRRVYLGAVIVLLTALQAGLSAARARQLQTLIGVSVRTLKRWRTWWRTTFVAAAFWRLVAGRFLPRVSVDALPASLLDRFGGAEVAVQLTHVLRFLSPLTTTSVSLGASLAMAARDPQTMPVAPPSPRS
jgi:hypothetical protein